MQVFDIKYVPLAFIEFIKSYLFISVFSVSVRDIALALFIKISTPPNLATTYSMALTTSSSFLISHYTPNDFPPASSISLHAEPMVPGNLGWGSTVLANMATLAPS